MFDIFSLKDFKFPHGFVWGSSTAGHQIEGDNVHSGRWVEEKEAHAVNPEYELSGKACDHYNRVDEDIELLVKLGHRAYRMSVEWARIQPEEGVFDKEATEHYIRELARLKERGITTFVTLVHVSMPYWFEQKGGFFDFKNFGYFETYLRYILPKISPYVDFWNIFNEFNLGISEFYLNKKFNHTICHAHAYHIMKEYTSAPISSAHAFVRYYGLRQSDPFDRAAQAWYDAIDNEFFFHAMRTGELVVPGKDGIYDKDIKDTCDFWSVNTYVRRLLNTRCADVKNARYPFTNMSMIRRPFYLEEFDPESLYDNLLRLNDKPIYITENGCSCDNDDFRIVWIAEYLSAVHAAIEAGADVRGYLYWSTMDNYEWGSYKPRFGLVDVDFSHDFKRKPKPSAYFYKEIIEHNGFTQEILRKYLHEMPRL